MNDFTNTKIIFILSVQHTGTWFIINFLNEHSNVDVFLELAFLIGVRRQDNVLDNIQYGKTNLVHSHIRTDNSKRGVFEDWEFLSHMEYAVTNALYHTYPTIVPLRDPLLSLISRRKRHPEIGDHRDIVDGFEYLVHMQDKVFFLPVDLYQKKTYEDRLSLLKNCLRHMGLTPEGYILKWANTWGYHNKSEPSRLDNISNNVEAIKKEMLLEWEYLQSKKDILKPFLEKIGYRDLLWWSS